MESTTCPLEAAIALHLFPLDFYTSILQSHNFGITIWNYVFAYSCLHFVHVLHVAGFGEVTAFKYLGTTLTKDGTCTAEIPTKITTATAATPRLNWAWKININFQQKSCYKSLVVSVLLYGCETWTLLADTEGRIQTFKTKCLRKLLHNSYREHKTNDYVRNLVSTLVGHQQPLLTTVRCQNLAWFGHVTRHHALSKTTVEGGWKWGRQRKSWSNNSKDCEQR